VGTDCFFCCEPAVVPSVVTIWGEVHCCEDHAQQYSEGIAPVWRAPTDRPRKYKTRKRPRIKPLPGQSVFPFLIR
jgi:hypothetical protein